MNEQYFSKEQVSAGELTRFVEVLNSEAYGPGGHYNDVRVKPTDCGAFVVQWVQLPWGGEYGGEGFKYVGEDQIVALERQLPDGRYGLFASEADFEAAMGSFRKEHPEYRQDHYGFWYAEKEEGHDEAPIVYSENGVPQV